MLNHGIPRVSLLGVTMHSVVQQRLLVKKIYACILLNLFSACAINRRGQVVSQAKLGSKEQAGRKIELQRSAGLKPVSQPHNSGRLA